MQPRIRTLYTKVAGVTYEGRQQHLARLHGHEAVRIVPEPTNQHDPNALAVYVALGGGEGTTPTIVQVGYVPRELAAEIAPLLDGEAVMVAIHEITGGFEIPGRDGEIANYGLILRVEVPEVAEEAADDDVLF